MAKSDGFRKTHQDIKGLVGQIGQRLNPAQLKNDVNMTREVSRLLANLTGTLTFHFAMEDKMLYPYMLSVGNGGVADVARKYMAEIGGLAKTYGEFTKKWSSREAIQTNADEFCSETRNLFAAMGSRIAKEESELYPLYDVN